MDELVDFLGRLEFEIEFLRQCLDDSLNESLLRGALQTVYFNREHLLFK